jgi:MoxR-like ATPase
VNSLLQPQHSAANSGVRLAASTTCAYQSSIDQLRCALNASLRGKADVVEQVLACLLAQGHLLIEDLPGLGKTTLAKALAQAVDGRFARVQCTPDLLPSDITGFTIFNQQTREFEFTEGPVFSEVLLADEINRATPRTQSALFEAMAERQVTIDKRCHRLSDAFFVIATQNPVESHGTYPLPEAQLDRFAMKISIGYPDRASELEMLAAAVDPPGDSRNVSTPVVTQAQLLALQSHVQKVEVCEKVRSYLVSLAQATRERSDVPFGLSPRGVLTWQRLAQAVAHLHGRDFVTPDDVQEMAIPVLAARLPLEKAAGIRWVEALLSEVPVPVHD